MWCEFGSGVGIHEGVDVGRNISFLTHSTRQLDEFGYLLKSGYLVSRDTDLELVS